MLQDNIPLQVPNQLLKNAIIKNKDIMETKYQYEKVGVNNTIIVDPAVAKFPGFEVNKLNILKVKVTNKSQKPQRIYVLPPQTQFFNVKFDKKGLLASGMAEELFIHFKPNEYKYYYDTLKINSGDDTLIIPIHAYPALSRDNIRDIFPRLIDFGTVEIGQSQSYVKNLQFYYLNKRYLLQCKIPLNFEFEFVVLKESSEMKINPLKGIIPGRGAIEIEITYQPQTNITIVVEAELKVSQFDFEPLQIKIMGSGRYQNQEGRKQQKRPSSNIKLKSITASDRQLQQSAKVEEEQSPIIQDLNSNKGEQQQFKTLMRSVNTQKPINVSLKKGREDQPSPQKSPDRSFAQINLQPGTRQSKEKAYLDHFNSVFMLDKEKDIKFFQCIGDWPITAETTKSILDERSNYINQKLKETREKEITRYDVQRDRDCPIIEAVVPKFECTWDTDKNDTIRIKRIKLKKFVQVVTRVIYRIRFDNRIQKIKSFLKGARSKEQVKKMVNQDWQKAEYTGVGKKDFVQFQFDFDETNLGQFLLPVQFNTSNNFSSFRFEIISRTGFDDWAPIDQIAHCDQEVMQYKNWEYPQLIFHPPLQAQVDSRTGAEEEYAVRGRLGPLSENVLGRTAQQDEVISQVLSKPPYLPASGLLEQHKTLKQLSNYNPKNPIETYYLMTFSKIQSIGADIDPDITLPQDILLTEFLYRTPGYNNLNLVHSLTIEQNYYQEKSYQLPFDLGLENEADKYCPTLMAEKEYDDHLTDDDSDGEGPPQLQVQDINDFLKKIEQDDKLIAAVKEKNKVEIQNQQEELENDINQLLTEEKKKCLATLPSKAVDFNKFIQSNINKLIIL